MRRQLTRHLNVRRTPHVARVCVFLGCVGLGVKSTPHDDDVAADPLSPETLRFGAWLWTWRQTTARSGRGMLALRAAQMGEGSR